jgi:hypothetical protein
MWPVRATSQTLCDKLATNMNRTQWNHWISPILTYTPLCPALPVPSP